MCSWEIAFSVERAFRLALKAGAAGIDAGDPTDLPRTDILGRLRSLGKGPDAGAYENG